MFSELEKSRQNVIYLLAVVATIVVVINVTPVINLRTILDFVFVIIIAVCYPLKINNVKRMQVYWLVIPILYLYGIVAMLLFYQLAITVFLFLSRTE